jgi:cytochrome c oxidase subunit II
LRPSAALLAVAALLLGAGCGTGGLAAPGDNGRGKDLFVRKCGYCHTLTDAGSQGKKGPNLDDAFAADREQGYKESTIRQVVRDQIELAIPPMPANLVKGADADAVASYIASVAGLPAQTTPSATPAAPTTTATGGGGGPATGKALYSSLGCVGCHSLDGSKGTGPTFKGLAGSKVTLAGGKTVVADDAYLLNSILDPDALIVAGFQPGIMSATITPHSISTTNAKALVAFIKAQK